MSVAEIASGVWRLEEGDGGRRLCQAVIVGERSALVVDAGLPASPRAGILPLLQHLGLAGGPVLLVLTHPDADHVGGTAELRRCLPQLTVCAGDEGVTGDPAVTLAVRGGERRRTLARLGEAFAVDLVPTGGVSLSLGSRVVEILRLPGHSPGHLGAWLPAERVAVIGDAVMGTGVPLRDGSLLYPPMYAPPGAYLATIERLERLEPAVLVTGHFPLLRDGDVTDFLAISRAACRRLADLVRKAPDREPSAVVAWVAEAYGGLPVGARAALAMTVRGHLATERQ